MWWTFPGPACWRWPGRQRWWWSTSRAGGRRTCLCSCRMEGGCLQRSGPSYCVLISLSWYLGGSCSLPSLCWFEAAESNLILNLYSLSLIAAWYGGAAALNTFLLMEILLSRLLTNINKYFFKTSLMKSVFEGAGTEGAVDASFRSSRLFSLFLHFFLH